MLLSALRGFCLGAIANSFQLTQPLIFFVRAALRLCFGVLASFQNLGVRSFIISDSCQHLLLILGQSFHLGR